MKGAVWLVLIACVGMLLFLILKKRLGIGWLVVFGAHMGLAAIALYVINYSGWITQVYIPINPVTMGAVTILGLPGIVLLLGLKIVLFGQAI
ncbi:MULTISPECIES: pro-sigmaK processing inhibitor BofA family protein [Paenibacillus]|jgi:inhibitor of the pro-sigma K processing machinery|uniref:Pro-sigmaK processing inhibitor BofA n=2 Tax=Paenibacillus TaxID=44249 RepID=A0AAJ3J0X5_PAEPO|nr:MULTISPECIES: pro-sigmaK processing inhibitor BofA family protein [Paenibacillus]AJW69094.1 pro-sigmaK processing inhibitor BofA [Paenibacillus polymyxa E681]ALA40171.1 pro-sigmaK processing inhibitor BofA [Paenibacillus peoriae]APB78141.1 pro-sigmaK processing inhibitor BofA [Paenibacillus polymyxa]APQ57402.1 pro-sigmaK processing inhibitor BofA [Paenibacillus polymyxa]KAF6574075.1 pro-sigmaK processing inhibitor BofA family protein [Paenibacillus sp. EKM212P]